MSAFEVGRSPSPVTLPCGWRVVIGQRDYEAVCEPHRLAQEQDAMTAAATTPTSDTPTPNPTEPPPMI